MQIRAAQLDDSITLADIYNQGIEERIATFETRPRSPEDIMGWFDKQHPIVVMEEAGKIIGFASTSDYRKNRECYAGIAEFSVYVAREARGRGVGKLVLEALINEAGKAGFWKLVSRVFVENSASLSLLRSVGFREVGIYVKHAKLEGVWRDVVIVERLIEKNL